MSALTNLAPDKSASKNEALRRMALEKSACRRIDCWNETPSKSELEKSAFSNVIPRVTVFTTDRVADDDPADVLAEPPDTFNCGRMSFSSSAATGAGMACALWLDNNDADVHGNDGSIDMYEINNTVDTHLPTISLFMLIVLPNFFTNLVAGDMGEFVFSLLLSLSVSLCPASHDHHQQRLCFCCSSRCCSCCCCACVVTMKEEEEKEKDVEKDAAVLDSGDDRCRPVWPSSP